MPLTLQPPFQRPSWRAPRRARERFEEVGDQPVVGDLKIGALVLVDRHDDLGTFMPAMLDRAEMPTAT